MSKRKKSLLTEILIDTLFYSKDGTHKSERIAYTIIENFGPRQMISFWRVGAYSQIFKKKSGGWDKAKRKRFTKNLQ